MRLYYCDHYDMGLPEGHRFPARKYRLLRELLAEEFSLAPAPLAAIDAIERIHEPAYVRAFLDGAWDMRRIGFPWSEALVARTLASVGGTLAATRDALSSGVGGTLAGGTHHAFRGQGAGFCVFNDIAVAIASLPEMRISVIDLDVHQGDGTAAIFADDPRVFTLSMHGRNNFPFRKQRSSRDVALDDGAGDEEYLRALDEALDAAFAHGPAFVFYQSGVDGLREDALGKLSLTMEGLAERDRRVFAAVRAAGVAVVVTIGGGYAEPIETTAAAHAQTFRIAKRELVLSSPSRV